MFLGFRLALVAPCALVALLVSLAAGVSVASATTMTVTTTADELTHNGHCSLRETVRNSNAAGQPHLDCPAGSGSDVILLDDLIYTLTLPGRDEQAAMSGDLDVTKTLVIVGGGQTIIQASTIVQAGAHLVSAVDRIFEVRPTGNLSLRFLTVRNGNALSNSDESGGAILSTGVLSLEEVTVTGSRARAGGGIAVITPGRVTINQSVISSNEARNFADSDGVGGGISLFESGTITQTTIANNTAKVRGGGIDVADTTFTGGVSLTQSTVSGNSAFGISLFNDVPVTLTNDTVSGNTGGGVLSQGSQPVTLSFVTVANNTTNPGLRVGASATSQLKVGSSIVANNPAGNCSGTITSLGDNLDSGATCGFTSSSNKQNADPLLGPLQDNGGRTFTHALGAGSPAINLVSFVINTVHCSQTTDQRGQPRPGSDVQAPNLCDSGAYEHQVKTPSFIGQGELSPTTASAAPRDRLTYEFNWQVPDDENWHALSNLQLRFRDADGVALWIRWNEAANTFQLVDQSGKLGPEAAPGSNGELSGQSGTLYLHESSVRGSGPTGPAVRLRLSVCFKEAASGRSLTAEVLATDDSGVEQGFSPLGVVKVLESQHP